MHRQSSDKVRLWTHFVLLLFSSPQAAEPQLVLFPHGNMKVQFAPMDVPLHRRLQTATVLQWVYSFLALGEI